MDIKCLFKKQFETLQKVCFIIARITIIIIPAGIDNVKRYTFSLYYFLEQNIDASTYFIPPIPKNKS